MRNITKSELAKILSDHALFVRGTGGECADLRDANLEGADLVGADLRYANLRYANLRDADLEGADLRYADLRDADLRGADLRGADLRYANFRGADLRYADLVGADLRYANLHHANLVGADLRGADLRGADLRGANLRDADLEGADLEGADLEGADLEDAILPTMFKIVPETGEFHCYKKVYGGSILELLVPEDAQRTSSLVGRKCRASKVKVVRVVSGVLNETVFRSKHDYHFVYEVGTWVEEPGGYDGDVRVECTRGIHFFMTQEEAEQY